MWRQPGEIRVATALDYELQTGSSHQFDEVRSSSNAVLAKNFLVNFGNTLSECFLDSF